MTYDQLQKQFGNQCQIAEAFHVKQSQVSLWKRKGIPMLRQESIQLRTAGRLTANIAHAPLNEQVRWQKAA